MSSLAVQQLTLQIGLRYNHSVFGQRLSSSWNSPLPTPAPTKTYTDAARERGRQRERADRLFSVETVAFNHFWWRLVFSGTTTTTKKRRKQSLNCVKLNYYWQFFKFDRTKTKRLCKKSNRTADTTKVRVDDRKLPLTFSKNNGFKLFPVQLRLLVKFPTFRLLLFCFFPYGGKHPMSDVLILQLNAQSTANGISGRNPSHQSTSKISLNDISGKNGSKWSWMKREGRHPGSRTRMQNVLKERTPVSSVFYAEGTIICAPAVHTDYCFSFMYSSFARS